MNVRSRLTLALAFLISASICVHPEAASWNVTSRLATVESLVDRDTFAIEGSGFKTGDQYFYAGHFYSDKPIVMSIVGAAVVEGLRAVHINIVSNRQLLLAVLTITTVSLPFGMAIAAIAELLRALGNSDRAAAAIATVAGSATLAFPFATVLINHVPAAACLLVGLVVIVRYAARSRLLILSGSMFALAIGIDSSYALFVIVAPLAIGRAYLRHYIMFAVGACIVLVPLAASNLVLSGTILPPDTNSSLYNYPGSPFAHGYILGSIGERSLAQIVRYAFEVTFGQRGLFLYSPILLIAVYGFVHGLRFPSSPETRRVLSFVTVASSVYLVSVVLGTTDYGGDTYGLRRFVGISLLMCLSLSAIWNQIRLRCFVRRVFLCVFGFSLLLTGLGVRDPLVTGSFPARDALPILFAYGRTHMAAAATHVIVLGILGTVAFLTVHSALTSNGQHAKRRGLV